MKFNIKQGIKKILKLLRSTDEWLRKLSPFWFAIAMTILIYATLLIIFIPVSFIPDLQISEGPTNIRKLGLIGKVLVACMITPLVETFLYQYLPINILGKSEKLLERSYVIIIVSAILFGLAHTYDIVYVFRTFIIGLFLAYTYVIYQKKSFSPFLMVCIIHAIQNAVVVVFETL